VNPRRRLATYFALAGFLGGAVSAVFLWVFISPQHPYFVIGLKNAWSFALFPFVGALLAAAWTTVFNPRGFGALFGAIVALLSFVTFCALIAAVGHGGLWGFLAFTFFGLIMFGWGLLLLGAVTGWYFVRHARRAL
jgi:hypothetical protein